MWVFLPETSWCIWQTLILYKWKKTFGWLPVETLIKERQEAYYKVLGQCDQMADSGPFIEFLLSAINDSLSEMAYVNSETVQVCEQVTVQVAKLLSVMENKCLSTKEMMALVGLKHRLCAS